MPTIDPQPTQKERAALVRKSGILMLALLLSPLTLTSASRRMAVSADAAFFWAAQKSVREVYSTAIFPVTIRLSYLPGDSLGIWAGFRYLRTKGQTKTIAPVFQEESYRTDLSIYGPQAGLAYTLGRRGIRLQLGAGASYLFFREEWQQAPYFFSGNGFGFQADAALLFPLGKRFSSYLKLAYLSFPTRQGSLLQSQVDLGGMEAGLGMQFRF